MSVVFTVAFDGRFYVGILEIVECDTVRAARHVFGAEPTDAELAAFCCSADADALLARAHSAPALPSEGRADAAARSPKRLARQVAREMSDTRSARSQQALHLAREAEQSERRQSSRAEAAARRSELRRLAAVKRRARHRGRA